MKLFLIIHLLNYTDNNKKIYKKIENLKILKNEIITNCFLKLLNKNIKIILKDVKNHEITIITKDFDEYKKDSKEDEIEVKYQIYKIQKKNWDILKNYDK